uniref:NADH-ubiquinone oxidoreductase chain 4L n=1 Tax=Ectenagena elongata TaxID=1885249 RepID=A0A7M3T202_9BIVA|nr:NADH dehydrogenase subunit 4L [Ectenagena elongata]QFG38766.1 NADH dehydrogenase subunit 4L [Ectenagena elongata]
MFVFFSLVHFMTHFNFFMNLLLVFELMGFCVFLFCMNLSYISFSGVGLYFCIVILTFSVCETVLGMALLVSAARYTGRMNVKSFSFLGF